MPSKNNLYSAQFNRERRGNASLGINHAGKLCFSAELPPSLMHVGPARPWYLAQELNSAKIGALIAKMRRPIDSKPPIMSADELANRAKVTQSAISDIELGNSQPRYSVARKLIAGLGRGLLFLSFSQTPIPVGEQSDPQSLFLLEPIEGYSKIMGGHLWENTTGTMQEVADNMGISQSNLSNFCNGYHKEPRFTTIEQNFARNNMHAGLLLVIPPS